MAGAAPPFRSLGCNPPPQEKGPNGLTPPGNLDIKPSQPAPAKIRGAATVIHLIELFELYIFIYFLFNSQFTFIFIFSQK